MTSITAAMFDTGAEAFFGKAGAACIDEDERNGLRDALEAVRPLIEAARLDEFADELVSQRDEVTCPDPMSQHASAYFRGRKDGLEQAETLARSAAQGKSSAVTGV